MSELRKFTIEEQNACLSPKDAAQMRWQAVEAFNTAWGLTPMARRLGIALITVMDAKSRDCFPSEPYLAGLLGVNVVSVKKAKAELREAGLISWENHGGPRHLSRYELNWLALLDLAVEAKNRAIECRPSRKTARSNGSPQTTIEPAKRSLQATIETQRNGSHLEYSGSHLDRKGSLQTTSIVAYGLPELSQDISHKDISLQNTPLGATCDAQVTPTASDTGQGEGREGALEEAAAPPRKPATGRHALTGPELERSYPGLHRTFKADNEAFAALLSIDRAQIAGLQTVQARDGQDVARAHLMAMAAERRAA